MNCPFSGPQSEGFYFCFYFKNGNEIFPKIFSFLQIQFSGFEKYNGEVAEVYVGCQPCAVLPLVKRLDPSRVHQKDMSTPFPLYRQSRWQSQKCSLYQEKLHPRFSLFTSFIFLVCPPAVCSRYFSIDTR